MRYRKYELRRWWRNYRGRVPWIVTVIAAVAMIFAVDVLQPRDGDGCDTLGQSVQVRRLRTSAFVLTCLANADGTLRYSRETGSTPP